MIYRICLPALTKLPLAIWTFNSGAGISCNTASGWAAVTLQSCDSGIAFWTTPGSKSKLISYILSRRVAYYILCFLSSCKAELSTLKLIESRCLAFFSEVESKVILKLVSGWELIKFIFFVFVSFEVPVASWLVELSSSVVPDWSKVISSSVNSSAKASYLFFVFGFWSSMLSCFRLLSACHPIFWCLFGSFGVFFFRWWWSLCCRSSPVLVVFWVSRCAPVVTCCVFEVRHGVFSLKLRCPSIVGWFRDFDLPSVVPWFIFCLFLVR